MLSSVSSLQISQPTNQSINQQQKSDPFCPASAPSNSQSTSHSISNKKVTQIKKLKKTLKTAEKHCSKFPEARETTVIA